MITSHSMFSWCCFSIRESNWCSSLCHFLWITK